MDYAEARAAFFQPRPADAPAPGTEEWASPARALRDAIEPIATICFWSEPSSEAYAAVGLDFLGGYVWGRASALGDAEGTVAAAAFGVFEPGLIVGLHEQARATCSLDDVRAARERGAVEALRTVLGDTDVAGAAEVLRRGVAAADPTGRPLHAGLLALPWPQDPVAALFHACSVLREHRGDGHLAACVAGGLTGLEANLVTEAQVGWERFSYTGTRGWSPEAMELAATGLAERGLLDDGRLTGAGTVLRRNIETITDALLAPVLAALGPDAGAVLPDLEAWSQQIVEAGWFPPDPYKRASG